MDLMPDPINAKCHTLLMPASHLQTDKNDLVEWCKNTVNSLENNGLENYWIEIKIHRKEAKNSRDSGNDSHCNNATKKVFEI